MCVRARPRHTPTAVWLFQRVPRQVSARRGVGDVGRRVKEVHSFRSQPAPEESLWEGKWNLKERGNCANR